MVMAHRLTVLSSTATAHAECARVLWQESSAVGYAVSWTQSGAGQQSRNAEVSERRRSPYLASQLRFLRAADGPREHRTDRRHLRARTA